MNGDELEVGETINHVIELAVEEDRALVDDDHAAAERLDIRHVVAREQDGRLALRVVVTQEFTNDLLRDDVEADGGLVEEQDLGLMQERGDELHLHALPE